MKLYVLYNGGDLIAYGLDPQYIEEIAKAYPQSTGRMYDLAFDITIPFKPQNKIQAVQLLCSLIPGLSVKRAKHLAENITVACGDVYRKNDEVLRDQIASLNALLEMKRQDIDKLEEQRAHYRALCDRMLKILTPEQTYRLMSGDA